MNKKYVISSSEFDSREEALRQIRKWATDRNLDGGAKVYEVKKTYQLIARLSLEELEK